VPGRFTVSWAGKGRGLLSPPRNRQSATPGSRKPTGPGLLLSLTVSTGNYAHNLWCSIRFFAPTSGKDPAE
jgi:hypothetical protein